MGRLQGCQAKAAKAAKGQGKVEIFPFAEAPEDSLLDGLCEHLVQIGRVQSCDQWVVSANG
jgi:hypothetical protein